MPADIPVPFNNRTISYTAVGTETEFETDFPLQDEADVTVQRTRAAVTVTLTITVDYTVAIDPTDGIATITPVGSVLAADVWALIGNTVIERVTDLPARPNADTMADLNTEFDRLTMICQELQRDFVAAALGELTLPLSVVNGGTGRSQALPTFNAHKNGSDQGSITSATPVKITFGTERWDVGDYYNAGTSVFTPAAGKYRISARLHFTATNAVDGEAVDVRLYKNAALYARSSILRGGASAAGNVLTVLVEANGTDTFEIYANKSGAGDGAIEGDSFDTWFEAEAIA
jgi:hypothetical protein